MKNKEIFSSFRDPDGFIFTQNGKILRQINKSYKENYELLMESGLYKKLTDYGLLVAHQEVNIASQNPQFAFKVIEPEKISFISYPYEWCFSQLKQAALITLKIQKTALDHGMSLKDATAYNIQFKKGRPVFIDTLSFEKYQDGRPWVAYRQFCEHFLGPLALASYLDIRLQQLLKVYIDGIPLNLISKLLPKRSFLNVAIFSHIHLHAKSQSIFSKKEIKATAYKMTHRSLLGIIDNLENTIKRLSWQPKETEWSEYYHRTNYSEEAFQCKKELFSNFLNKIKVKNSWDLGANTGIFSRIALEEGIEVISFDSDPLAVEKNYQKCLENREENILPILMDLANPSSAIGWENKERESLLDRAPTDAVFALALIHHLAIVNNLGFEKIAKFFSEICEYLIIEFIPKNDSQVQFLLRNREDIFSDYTQEGFEQDFSQYFAIKDSQDIKGSFRKLYLMQKK